MGKKEGKRAAQVSTVPIPKMRKYTILIAAVIVAVVVVYLCLCAYVSASSAVLPRTSTQGIALGGLTQEEALQKLDESAAEMFAGREITFAVDLGDGEAHTLTVSGDSISLNIEEAAEEAAQTGREGSFLTRGASLLKALFVGNQLKPDVTFSDDSQIEDLFNNLTQELALGVVETSYERVGDDLVIHKGSAGQGFQIEEIKAQILDAFRADSVDNPAFTVYPTVIDPQPCTLEEIYDVVYTEMTDPTLDPTTKEVVPAVAGVSFDVAAAQPLYDATPDGEDCIIALTFTYSTVTTEQYTGGLYKDVLAETKSTCSGSSSRLANIALAASFVDGTILLPGETFSYTALCGPYDTSKGYQKAGAYVNGKTVDTTAGGICQLSSTLYWATLVANLETVERKAHVYNVGYLPVVGTDATVYGSSPDFKFKNSTDYPIKISCYKDDSRVLHVTIYGTDTTGIHGEPYNKVTATVTPKTVYEADASVPVGTTKADPERTAYTGMTVEVYLKLIDKNGTVVETKYLHTDTFKSRDRVILYNPADAAKYGTDTSTSTTTTATASPSPSPSASAAATASPSATPATTTPTATPATDTDTPTATPTPVPSATQAVETADVSDSSTTATEAQTGTDTTDTTTAIEVE
ncbi:MAG: VanW family protein [Oscillospiraceae bacterium]|nr:VanW family protein [Oscillospiraceae bacterium]